MGDYLHGSSWARCFPVQRFAVFFLAVKHNVCLQHDGSAFQTVPICVDWTRCRYFPVDACFIYLVNENNWKIQMEIKSDTWNWNTIYLLYLRLLCHPAYSHFYNCVCLYVRSFCINRDVLIHLWAQSRLSWMGTPLRLQCDFSTIIYFLQWISDGNFFCPFLLSWIFGACFCSVDRGEVDLLSLIPRSRPPTFLCGHRGGTTQQSAAEEDRPVDSWKSKRRKH